LFGNDARTDRQAAFLRRTGSEADDLADELVTGNNRRFQPGRLDRIAPDRGRTMERFDVAHTDADGLDPREHFERAGFGTGTVSSR